jgi:hypothetical protein
MMGAEFRTVERRRQLSKKRKDGERRESKPVLRDGF